jgi:hypothetical protein
VAVEAVGLRVLLLEALELVDLLAQAAVVDLLLRLELLLLQARDLLEALEPQALVAVAVERDRLEMLVDKASAETVFRFLLTVLPLTTAVVVEPTTPSLVGWAAEELALTMRLVTLEALEHLERPTLVVVEQVVSTLVRLAVRAS